MGRKTDRCGDSPATRARVTLGTISRIMFSCRDLLKMSNGATASKSGTSRTHAHERSNRHAPKTQPIRISVESAATRTRRRSTASVSYEIDFPDLNDDDRELIATSYHEAGHTLLAYRFARPIRL